MDINKHILEDLKIYNQDKPYPKTLTIVEEKYFRHYELGPIFGFCIYNDFDSSGRQFFMIRSIQEDDGFWTIPNEPMNMESSWIPAVEETFNRALRWYREHFFEGWADWDINWGNPDYYRREIIKPIVEEEKYESDDRVSAEHTKDSDKAILAVEKIDEYINMNTANAHDMSDSNPDKKYYQGVDDTLSNISGILIDVYSGKQ